MWYLSEALLAGWDAVMRMGNSPASILVSADNKTVFGIDMSIESLRSQQYSHFIFGFLVVSIIIFSVIIYLYLPKKGNPLKRGEKIMVGAIIMGILIALYFGWLQLVEGFLV